VSAGEGTPSERNKHAGDCIQCGVRVGKSEGYRAKRPDNGDWATWCKMHVPAVAAPSTRYVPAGAPSVRTPAQLPLKSSEPTAGPSEVPDDCACHMATATDFVWCGKHPVRVRNALDGLSVALWLPGQTRRGV